MYCMLSAEQLGILFKLLLPKLCLYTAFKGFYNKLNTSHMHKKYFLHLWTV